MTSPILKGRKALITGSTGGIGAAVAIALAQAGADVALNGRTRTDEAEAMAAKIAADHGVKAQFIASDVSTTKGARGLVEAAAEALGGVDILVNNAGIQHVAPIDSFPEETLDQLFRINFFSAFHCMAAAIPGMKAGKWGRIISITSAHALVASPFKAPYVASKHAVTGLTKTAALEVATDGITVNCIAPGYVWTPLVEKQIPDTMAARKMSREAVIDEVLLKAQPTKRFVTVEEVGAAAVFLASDAAASITGSTITIDGGWTAA